MDSLKTRWKNLPLRHFFILTVILSISIVVLISALIIAACISFRHWLLPESNAAYLTIEKTLAGGSSITEIIRLEYREDLSSLPIFHIENVDISAQENTAETKYSIQKIDNSLDMLSPKRRFAYQVSGITMIAAPALLAFAGIILCGLYFYRYKLKHPLRLLSDATNQIAQQNLDFEIQYDCKDELGALCYSFEKMRAALYTCNKAMWDMLEERRLLQASVAHDLRNPIAIIEGYTEYLDAGFKNGTINQEKTCRIIQNLNVAAKRLEQYTESVRLLNQSEETELIRKSVPALNLAESITEDLTLLAEQNKIILQVTKNLPDKEIQVDSVILYRILENIINNALRYANHKIKLDFSLTDALLTVTVTDDGDGFPTEILNKKEKTLLTAGKDGHMGIGLSISRLLCQKHGGSLEVSNTSCGACVKISLSV